MNVNYPKKVYCIGIGGIGVSALARFFASGNAQVSGSNNGESEELALLRKRGITVYTSHDKKHVPKDADLVIFSPAIPKENEELIEAKEAGIETLSYPQALGRLTADFTTVAISGTNGKTTVTALLGTMLETAKKDPTVIVGGRVSGWDNNLRVGKGDILVVEGCEYKRSMMELHPHMIVLTNIEEDHLDYYKDIDDIVDAFSAYVAKLTEDDTLMYNADDTHCVTVSKLTRGRAISFGLQEGAMIRAKDIKVLSGIQQFTLEVYGKDVGVCTTHLPGSFNIYNILASITAALDLGVAVEHIQETLDSFHSSWRRFEQVGEFEDAVVISDYAHHPTAIKGTLRATREFFAGKKILAVFQPHHEDRTIKLFDDFVESFADADEVVVSEIYHVAGREEQESKISSKDLVRAIAERGGVDTVVYGGDLEKTEKIIRKKAQEFDVVLVMGAGDIDQVARNLIRTK
jgi:UDP-N-acetylmuramate--alanine ligase